MEEDAGRGKRKDKIFPLNLNIYSREPTRFEPLPSNVKSKAVPLAQSCQLHGRELGWIIFLFKQWGTNKENQDMFKTCLLFFILSLFMCLMLFSCLNTMFSRPYALQQWCKMGYLVANLATFDPMWLLKFFVGNWLLVWLLLKDF